METRFKKNDFIRFGRLPMSFIKVESITHRNMGPWYMGRRCEDGKWMIFREKDYELNPATPADKRLWPKCRRKWPKRKKND